jgi:uncharacterized protein
VQLHEDGTLVVSATDLVGFLECDHLVTLEQLRARGELEQPVREDPELELIRKRGYEHERRYIAQLEARGRTVVEMRLREPRTPADLRASEAETLAAMRAGTDVIFQGTLFDGAGAGILTSSCDATIGRAASARGSTTSRTPSWPGG